MIRCTTFGGSPGRDVQGRGGVPQTTRCQTVQPGRPNRRQPHPRAEVARPQQIPAGRAEHQVIRASTRTKRDRSVRTVGSSGTVRLRCDFGVPSTSRPAHGSAGAGSVTRTEITTGDRGRVGRSTRVRSHSLRPRSFDGVGTRPRASSGCRSALAAPPLTGPDDPTDSAATRAGSA